MNDRPIKVLGVWLLLVTVMGCRNNKMVNATPELVCTTPVEVSFNKDVLPILVNNCATSGCHSGQKPEGNFNLEASIAYKTLSKRGSGYIDTITPRYSVLYGAMVSESDPMPPTGKLDKCKLEVIEKWMQQKAKNN